MADLFAAAKEGFQQAFIDAWVVVRFVLRLFGLYRPTPEAKERTP